MLRRYILYLHNIYHRAEILNQIATALGIDASSVVKTQQEIEQEQQQAMQMQMAQQVAPQMMQGQQ